MEDMNKWIFSILVAALLGLAQAAYALPGTPDREQLPEPVYDEQPGYVDLYWKAWDLAWDHVKEDEGLVQSPYMDEAWYSLTTGKDGRIWIWDTEFMALFCKYAPQVFPGIQSLDNFYGPILDGKPSSQIIHHPDNPAFFPWVEWEYYKFTGDRARIDTLITVKGYLPRFYDFFRVYQDFEPHTIWECYDPSADKPALDKKGNLVRKDNGSILWVDALGEQALAALYIQKLAAEVGNKEVEKRFCGEYKRLCDLLNRYYWDKQDHCYYDLYEKDRTPTRILTPASFWAMLAQVPSRANAQKMARFALSDERLGGERPWKSVSASDKAFVKDGGQYWRGGIWLPTAYMGIKALEASGQQALADKTAAKLLRQILAVYQDFEPHTIWECYDPSADKPALDKKGWDVCSKGKVGLRRLRFDDIQTDLVCENGIVTVRSNAPYTLLLNGKKKNIPAGESSFKLK